MLKDRRIAEEARLLHHHVVDEQIEFWRRLIEVVPILLGFRQLQFPAPCRYNPLQARRLQHPRIDANGRRQPFGDRLRHIGIDLHAPATAGGIIAYSMGR